MNEWQLEAWLRPEPRLRGSVVVPYEDAEASAAEIRKRAGDPNFSQVLMLSRTAEPAGNGRATGRSTRPPPSDGLPVAFHAFGYSGWADDRHRLALLLHRGHERHATLLQNQVTSLVVEGVFERFPTLKVVLIEGGFAWLPSARVAARPPLAAACKAEVPHLTPRALRGTSASTSGSRPSRWRSRSSRRHLRDVMGWIGWDRILFATDYPHWDFDDPRAAFPADPAGGSAPTIYGGNARRVYGF